MISVDFYSQEYTDLPVSSLVFSLPLLIVAEGFIEGEISIIICSDDELLEINRNHLNHDYYTDIITFDYSEGANINGDLFVSIDRIKENSDKFEVRFEEELHRVIFHGVLHMMGYNDKSNEEQTLMRSKENHYLKELFHVKHP